MSLGLNLCVYVPRTLDDLDAGPPSTGSSTAALVSPAASSSSSYATSANTTPTADPGSAKGPGALMPTTPTPTSAGLRLSKSGSKSFKVPPPPNHVFCNITLKKKELAAKIYPSIQCVHLSLLSQLITKS